MGKRGRKWEVMEKREEARRLPQNMERLRRAAQEQEEATGRLRPQFHCLLQIPGRTSTSHPPGKTFTHLRTGAFFVPTAWQLSSLIMLILLFQQPTATCQCPLKSNENPPLSDSDDDEVKKTNKWKGITIRPATAGPSANSSASVDELQRVVGGLDISATLPVNQCLPCRII